MSLLLGIILAHIAGDFLLLSKDWAESIEARKATTWRLYLHFVLYGAVSLLVVRPWIAGLVLTGAHVVIRLTSLFLPTTIRRRFFIDLTLHAIGVIAIVAVFAHVDVRLVLQLFEGNLAFITGILFLTKPASAIIRHVISRWNPDPEGDSPGSLEKAGTWIGILERLFVFLFVLSGHYNAIGFLLAAKSVFRFGDLREAHDRKLTEYILIGTLLSVGIALIVAMAVRALS